MAAKLTEEEKAARKAAKENKKQEPVAEEKAPETFTKEQVQALVEAAVKEAMAKMQAATANSVVQVTAEKPMVKLLFMDSCSDDNYIQFGNNGKFGSITGPIGRFSVSRDDFFGEFRDNFVQLLLKKRKLLVMDGLTDEERAMYEVSYAPNEVMSEDMFRNFVERPEKLLDVYQDLCPAYKDAVASKFLEAYENGDKRILGNRDLIVKLNKLSKKLYRDLPDVDPRRDGDFIAIIRGMNERDEADERD